MMNFLQNIGTLEIIIGAVIVVVLFGGKKFPEFGRGIGDAVKTFKQGLKGQSKE